MQTSFILDASKQRIWRLTELYLLNFSFSQELIHFFVWFSIECLKVEQKEKLCRNLKLGIYFYKSDLKRWKQQWWNK